MLRLGGVVLVALACAGCGQSRDLARWDGRRGYDGRGDYGYDLAAARAEAGAYRAKAAPDYPAPGPPDDPWGPYIRAAAGRFRVPERWIREVMRQESGGRPQDVDGSPLTSAAGAMGLMQVMPQTYDMLRQRYGLRDDPYEPHDNIMAGAAYIREMADIYGAPGFLAAYNAGPDRLDQYLSGGTALPEETVNYLASVAPRLGGEVAMSGRLAVYATGTATVADTAPPDASDRAFDGGGLVTPDAPTGNFTPPVQPMILPVAETATASGGWSIQVGAFADSATAWAAVAAARVRGGDWLHDARADVTPVRHAGVLYRARLVGLPAATAAEACGRLVASGMDCIAVQPGA